MVAARVYVSRGEIVASSAPALSEVPATVDITREYRYEEGQTLNDVKKKRRQESPILRQQQDLAAMVTTRSVVPNACLLLQPTAYAPSSHAGRRFAH